MKIRNLFLFIPFLFCHQVACAQYRVSKPIDTLAHKKFISLVNFNKDQSYLTLGNGIGNQIPIIFEAQLSPSYFVSSSHKKWAVMINPQVQIRMLDQYSVPIQVPSYHLYLTYYRYLDSWRNTFLSRILYSDAIWFASVVHHSNGQSGKFYTNDTTKAIDLTGGSFAVNYIQLGISSFTLNTTGSKYFSLREIKVHTELYPSSWCDPHLNGIYGFTRLFATLDVGGPRHQEKKDWVNRLIQNSSIEVKSGWIFGALRGFSLLDVSKRLIVDLNYKYYPPWLDEIAFFVRFYSGQDYYNIYFEKQLTTLTVGITSSTIKLANNFRFIDVKKKKQGNY